MPGSSPPASEPGPVLSDAHRRALAVVAERLAGHELAWAITGSAAFALQGLPLTAHDVDLQTDAAGAYECERLLAEFVTQPVTFSQAGAIRSHFGRLEIESIVVEVMGDVEKQDEGGAWSAPPDIPSLRRWIEAEGLRLPVLSLRYEATAYRALGRPERAALIERWLASHPGAG